MWTTIIRKCNICKQNIILDQDNVVYYKERYSHFDCYVNYKLSMKRNKLTKDEIIKNTIDIQNDGNKTIKNIIIKEQLCKWLQYNYNIVSLPNYFFIKLDSVYNGTYKGLLRGIPPEDLLDMWQRKKKELDNIANKNKSKGNQINGIGRLQYDLAIIISKYDSYLNWKEKQKIFEQEQNKLIQESQDKQINYSKINKTIDIHKNNNETNINNLIDELF